MLFNVEDLLALPQLKQGKLPKNIQRVNLRDAAEEVVDIMDYSLVSKHIDFSLELVGFPQSGDYHVQFDKQRFQQIFLNYLSNAIKFTQEPGRIKVTLIKIQARQQIEKNYLQTFTS